MGRRSADVILRRCLRFKTLLRLCYLAELHETLICNRELMTLGKVDVVKSTSTSSDDFFERESLSLGRQKFPLGCLATFISPSKQSKRKSACHVKATNVACTLCYIEMRHAHDILTSSSFSKPGFLRRMTNDSRTPKGKKSDKSERIRYREFSR